MYGCRLSHSECLVQANCCHHYYCHHWNHDSQAGSWGGQNIPDDEQSRDREKLHLGTKVLGPESCPCRFSAGHTHAATVSSPSALSFKFIFAAIGKAHLLSWSWRQWLNLYRLQQFATGANKCFCCVTSITSQCAFRADGGAGAGAGTREERTCG